MIGLLKSLSRKPTARSIERFGARCTPSVISLLRRFSAIVLSPWTKRIFERSGTEPTESIADTSPMERRSPPLAHGASRRKRRPALRLRHHALLAAPFDAARPFDARSRSRFRVHVLPQFDSAEQPLLVAHNFHALGRFKADELAIAAAEEEPVVVERGL